MEKKKTHIKVFITRTCRFRAHIYEYGKPSYEVTINGKSWKKGKGKKYEKIIREKMRQIITTLATELGISYHIEGGMNEKF